MHKNLFVGIQEYKCSLHVHSLLLLLLHEGLDERALGHLTPARHRVLRRRRVKDLQLDLIVPSVLLAREKGDVPPDDVVLLDILIF